MAKYGNIISFLPNCWYSMLSFARVELFPRSLRVGLQRAERALDLWNNVDASRTNEREQRKVILSIGSKACFNVWISSGATIGWNCYELLDKFSPCQLLPFWSGFWSPLCYNVHVLPGRRGLIWSKISSKWHLVFTTIFQCGIACSIWSKDVPPLSLGSRYIHSSGPLRAGTLQT